MKIGQFNTTTACNVPRKLSLREPFPPHQVIRDENGDTVDIWVYGSHSDIARNSMTEKLRRSTGKLSDEEKDNFNIEFLASVTQGWSANLEDDNGPIEFSMKAAVELYKKERWILTQVDEFAGDLGNYDPKRYSKPASGSQSGHGSTVRQKGQTKAEPQASSSQEA